MESYIKFIREVRIMSKQLPAWRFVALVLVGLLFALGYLSGNLPWDKFL